MVKSIFSGMQKLGLALMLPIAVLPIAGLLLRLGQPDVLNIAFIAASGDAIFSNLGLLFAVGVAVGLAKDNHGAAGVAGLVGYFVAVQGATALASIPAADVAKMASKISVPVGILAGLFAGGLYNRYRDIKLPDYLAFFGGRRFVPIVTGFAALGLALVFGFGWPWVEAGLDGMSRSVLAAGSLGLFLYGFLNRLLIVTGMHHILNNVVWFILGDYHGATGDLKRFVAGDPSAGAFMTGYFPIMMFGLPAACLAMYRSAYTKNRQLAGGMLLSMALTSFLTGVTEPVEFAFMFLAPLLYLVHAILTGISLVIMNLLDVKIGFGFSAGLIDYVINYGKSTHPILLIPIGAAYFAVYYVLFRVVIARFDLKTIGREPEMVAVAAQAAPLPLAARSRGESYLRALGGAGNIQELQACATRLRLSLIDNGRIDESALKGLGTHGVLRAGKSNVQIIVGPLADQIAMEIQEVMHSGATGQP